MKEKIVYSRNEMIVRAIAIIGIILSFAIGIMLFPLGKVTGGIIVLCTSFVACFLVSRFFIRIIKSAFSSHKYKRFIYAAVYGIIMTVSMLTAVLVSYFSAYPYEDLSLEAIEYTEEKLTSLDKNIINVKSEIFDSFESGDSYYIAIETDFEVVGTGNAIAKRSSATYLQINKYTASISIIESLQYEIAKSYE